MALHFALRVNDTSIGYFSAVRISGCSADCMTPDSVNEYAVTIVQYGRAADVDDSTKVFTVEHRYGDGALALVAKALDFARTVAPAADTVEAVTHA